MAIDQPIDFSVPESTVMLAVYLAVPEAEIRRAQNTSNGIRRAKLMGRYPNKAPIGYINSQLVVVFVKRTDLNRNSIFK